MHICALKVIFQVQSWQSKRLKLDGLKLDSLKEVVEESSRKHERSSTGLVSTRLFSFHSINLKVLIEKNFFYFLKLEAGLKTMIHLLPP